MERRRFLRGMLAGVATLAAAPLAAKLPMIQPANVVADELKLVVNKAGARTEFKDGCWTIYDHSGTARVKLGCF